jgi:5,5'-dehydrodivanillate O-demethylase
VISVEANDRLTQVSSGTPMGELLRRYWHPIAATAELSERPTKSVRVLGEDLVLYRDRSGTYGLLDRLCPHRRVDLTYGIPEEHGLRCMYHGWMYDETGQCIEQPFEETVHPDGRFKEKVRVRAYPIEEMGGLLWTYMGPAPKPLLPRWEPLVWDNAVRDIGFAVLPCNWLQCQENSLDPVHNEWLHAYLGNYVRNDKHELPAGRGKHLKIAFDIFERGVIKRRVEEGFTEEDDDWEHGHPALFPNILHAGSEGRCTLQFRVPIDDVSTLHVTAYVWRAAPGTKALQQDIVPYRYIQLKDEADRYLLEPILHQDYAAWVTQGPIANRNRERLGESDIGIILYRKMLVEQMDVVADGGDPMNVFRDPAENEALPLPLERVKFGNRVMAHRPLEEGDTTPVKALVEAALQSWSAAP